MRSGVISLGLLLACPLLSQTPESQDPLAADKTIEGLRQIAKELSDSVRRFNLRLDQAAAKFDRGYRNGAGARIQAADVDLSSPGDIVQTAVRKSIAFRMLAARTDRYQPEALADLDHLHELIREAKKRTEESSAILRRLLVVSSQDLNPRSDKETRARHDQLLKARSAAERAAQEAYTALPVEAPEPESNDDGHPAWNLSINKTSGLPPPVNAGPINKPPDPKTPVPVRIERRRRITLIKENSCRIALTDSGFEDESGRHLFYEEQWLQRGDVVIRKRWRVAVDTVTGHHVLIKRYPPLELAGFLRDVYEPVARDHLWYVEPPEDASAPSSEQLEQALTDTEKSRTSIEQAVERYRAEIRDLLAHEDARRIDSHQTVLDAGLPASLRESLFAIRADLGGVSAIIQAETRVHQAIQTAERSVNDLEPMAAWANRASDNNPAGALTPVQWDAVLQRSDREIDLIHAAEKEAIEVLPPDLSQSQAQFPALAKGLIVRMRRLPSQGPREETVRCLEEIWQMENTIPGIRQVRRTAILVSVDPKTGNEVLTRGKTTYYRAEPDDALEEIFDEYAADDLLTNDRS